MEKHILICGDTNDGDYIHRLSPISDERIALLKPMMIALEKSDGEYPTGEMASKRHSAKTIYRSIPGFEMFNDYTPYGEYGIHTIESVEIVEILEKLY